MSPVNVPTVSSQLSPHPMGMNMGQRAFPMLARMESSILPSLYWSPQLKLDSVQMTMLARRMMVPAFLTNDQPLSAVPFSTLVTEGRW